MKPTYFPNTKKHCLNLANEILTISNSLFIKSEEKNQSTLSIKELSSICNTNNSIIQSINTIKEEIFEGKINNHRQYLESDLSMIDVILNIYTRFGQPNDIIHFSNYNKLKSDFVKQIIVLKNAVDLFPEDMATNVKRRPRIISTISLDYYQLIYLALSHSMLKIQGLLFTHNILELAKNKSVS